MTSNIFGQQSLIKREKKNETEKARTQRQKKSLLIYTKCKFVDTKKEKLERHTHTRTKDSVSRIQTQKNNVFFLYLSLRVSMDQKKQQIYV